MLAHLIPIVAKETIRAANIIGGLQGLVDHILTKQDPVAIEALR